MLEGIKFEAHAFARLIQRSCQYGLSWREARERIIETIRNGKESKRKHLSKKREHKTYCKYFADNLSFYVICKEKKFSEYKKYWVKTVIIETGRE
ncbi:MAG: hypothetical protein COT15_00050 [Candidatus Diapherotrites archaeon CG08_land_8_20_14_0_20_34_12]|nr:MAG: hypothetical protein COT15_00050 [Candidatus Diapherotrites archaeon CG08_land_8_20_14_0_20_34_12]